MGSLVYVVVFLVVGLGGFLLWRVIDAQRNKEHSANVTVAELIRRDGACFIRYKLEGGKELTCRVPEAEMERRRPGDRGELRYIQDSFAEFFPEEKKPW